MVSFWPRPRKTVLTGTFLFPLKLEFLVTNYEVILPCLELPAFFFWSARCIQESRNGVDANYLCSFVLNRSEKSIDLSTG